MKKENELNSKNFSNEEKNWENFSYLLPGVMTAYIYTLIFTIILWGYVFRFPNFAPLLTIASYFLLALITEIAYIFKLFLKLDARNFKETTGINLVLFVALLLTTVGFLFWFSYFAYDLWIKNRKFNKKVEKLIEKQINNSLKNWELIIYYDDIFNRSLKFEIITNRILWKIKKVIFVFRLNNKNFYFNYSLVEADNFYYFKNNWTKIKNIKFVELWNKNTKEDFLKLKNWIELNKNSKSKNTNFLKEINLTKKIKKIEIKTKSCDEKKLDLEKDNIEFKNVFVKNIIKKNEVNESEFYVVPDKDNFALSIFSQEKLRVLKESNYLIELTSKTDEINVELHQNLLSNDMGWIKEIVWKDTF